MKLILAMIVALGLTACAGVPQREKPTAVRNDAESKWAEGTGSGVVKGQAFLKQKGGTVVTCAGSYVKLYPVSTYSKDIMRYNFGNELGGYHYGTTELGTEVTKEQFRFQTCDAQGNFEFTDLPKGNYYLKTAVTWNAGGLEGGTLARMVTVADKPQKIIMAY